MLTILRIFKRKKENSSPKKISLEYRLYVALKNLECSQRKGVDLGYKYLSQHIDGLFPPTSVM